MDDVVLVRTGEGVASLVLATGERQHHALPDLGAWVAARDAHSRWVWPDTSGIYPGLLARGVRVRYAVDLRLTRRLLRGARAVASLPYGRSPPSVWDEAPAPTAADPPTLMDDLVATAALDLDDVVAEHRAQQEAVAAADDAGRLRLLAHAESTGALVAAEMGHVGVPFSIDVHDRQLTALLGPQPLPGGRPVRMQRLATELAERLGAPGLNPDSPGAVLAALRHAGLEVSSTRQWELERLDHPAIAPLLDYKRCARLLSANGWAWMHTWVRDGRFRPDWVPSGVVTGRWASRGGGALQLPRQIRAAVRAEPGWSLVVADAAQLEPRVLAAMAGDQAMARAARGADLYQGLVDQQVVATRAEAKLAMLGALYGSTTGESGALMPRLARAYPAAIGWVEAAARSGERGEEVTTWLGRTSPVPPDRWWQWQSDASAPGAARSTISRAGSAAREWGRFTRNFVVQGTAAEWALCWLGHLRRELQGIDAADHARPELVYFLHDEVMVHTPTECAEQVAAAIGRAGAAARVLLFGRFPIEFGLQVTICDSYDQAK